MIIIIKLVSQGTKVEVEGGGGRRDTNHHHYGTMDHSTTTRLLLLLQSTESVGGDELAGNQLTTVIVFFLISTLDAPRQRGRRSIVVSWEVGRKSSYPTGSDYSLMVSMSISGDATTLYLQITTIKRDEEKGINGEKFDNLWISNILQRLN